MMRKTLAIETSCDETAAAVYDQQSGVRSSVLFSQIEQQQYYGGVVPEIASRTHIEKINNIVAQALKQATVSLRDIDCIAVTNRPGLPGSLLVGVSFAKAIAWATNKKIVGVNHLEGHIFSSFLENTPPFPHICLTASGGHTALYLVKDFGNIQLLGETLDDAAGEAFDKVAKMINLPYPGGPVIEKMAQAMAFEDFFHYPRSMPGSLQFSFSGLKTAVLYDLVKRGWYDLQQKKVTAALTQLDQQKIASSLLVCVNDIILSKLARSLTAYPHIRAITFVGGVACNKFIKNNIADYAQKNKLLFFSPSAKYCTDNAAMIAFVGNYKANQQLYDGYDLDIY